MILSSERKFLFIHIPKTAGTSISAVLEQYQDSDPLGMLTPHTPNDIRQQVTLENLLPIHLTLKNVGMYIDRPIADYFRFAFVRNPWDRYLSMYHDWRKNEGHIMHPRCMEVDFNTFIEDIWNGLTTIETKTQLLHVIDSRLVNAMSFIGRFENLEEDFAFICKQIGIKNELPHLNKGTREQHYRDSYSSKSRDIVAKLCELEISYFGYRF